MRGLFLPTHEAVIRWHEVGRDGPAVLWLAGISMPAVGSFLSVVTHPALRGARHVLLDLIGAGVSDAAARPLDLEAHAASVAAVLDHLDCGPCAVFGHSMGGTVGVALALSRPDLVSSLSVGEANIDPGGGGVTRRIASVSEAAFLAALGPEMLAKLKQRARGGDAQAGFMAGAWGGADMRALHANAVALVNLPFDFADRFLSLAQPRAFLYGARTHPAQTGAPTPDAPDPARLEAHGVTPLTIPDCGHELMLTNPDGFATAAQALLGLR